MTLTPTASDRGERSPNPSESRSSVPWKKHERCVWCPRNSVELRNSARDVYGVPGTPWQRPNGARSQRAVPLFQYGTKPGDPYGKINPFFLARRRWTVDHSLAAGGAQRQWLQGCLPDGHQPQWPSSLCLSSLSLVCLPVGHHAMLVLPSSLVCGRIRDSRLVGVTLVDSWRDDPRDVLLLQAVQAHSRAMGCENA